MFMENWFKKKEVQRKESRTKIGNPEASRMRNSSLLNLNRYQQPDIVVEGYEKLQKCWKSEGGRQNRVDFGSKKHSSGKKKNQRPLKLPGPQKIRVY